MDVGYDLYFEFCYIRAFLENEKKYLIDLSLYRNLKNHIPLICMTAWWK